MAKKPNKSSAKSNGASATDERTTPFSTKELEHFKQLILDKRHNAVEDIERMHLQLKDSREQAENDSAYSFHMAGAPLDVADDFIGFFAITLRLLYADEIK